LVVRERLRAGHHVRDQRPVGGGSPVRARAAWAVAAAVALAAAGEARAASIDLEASDLGGGSVVELETEPGALAFDPAFVSFAPMRLVIQVESGESGAPIAWNALVDNLTGALWGEFTIDIEGAQFQLLGTVAANAGAIAGVDGGADGATVRFSPPGEAAGLDIGSAAGIGVDWMIDLGLVAAPSFVLVLTPVPAPEPGAGVAALAAFGALAALSRRWRGRRAAR
jgi:hypothetical protein